MKGKALTSRNRDVVENLYLKYARIMRQYFARRVNNRAEAEDLTQDLMVRLSQHDNTSEVKNPEAFMFTVASNMIKDRHRRGKLSDRFLIEEESTSEKFEGISPERVVIGRQSVASLMRALDSLDARARNVFILSRMEGMSYAEIARLCGLSISSIEKDMMRALKDLAKYPGLKD